MSDANPKNADEEKTESKKDAQSKLGTSDTGGKEQPVSKKDEPSDLVRTNQFFLGFVLLAALSVLTQLILGGIWDTYYVGVSFLWAFACLVAGAALGFLFGIPKVNNSGKKETTKTANNDTDEDHGYNSEVNSNLMEISDWLTKIIVGLGLINLKELPGYLKRIAKPLAECLPCDCALAFALGIIVCFTTVGFLFGYLYTRLFISIMLDIADRTLAGKYKKSLDARKELKEENLAMSAQVESADAASAVFKRKTTSDDALLKEPASITAEAINPQKADQIQSKTTQTTTSDQKADPNKNRILELAKEFAVVESPDPLMRVALRNQKMNDIAGLVAHGQVDRAWLADQAVKHADQGLIAGLAAAINADPHPSDLNLLLKTAPLATTPHAQNVILIALGRLFTEGIAGKQNLSDVANAIGSFVRSFDPGVKKRLSETASLIKKVTGIPLSFL